MNKLYEVLEVCLNELERGTDVDTVLFRYPEYAEELRPILDASVKARQMAVPAPSQGVVRRNRAKLLQQAAEMRESKIAPASRRFWSVPLRRALVAFMVVTLFLASGTGLVRAASTTLPGDNLYPVKRTWEDLRLFFAFDSTERETLELEHENERLEELYELFAEGRSAEVDFAGYVTRQNGTEWRVSGITVFISSETQMPEQDVNISAAVRVHGQIWNSGVLAAQIKLLPSGSKLPQVEDDELKIETEQPEIEDETGSGSVLEPTVVPTKIPSFTPEVEPEDVTVKGTVTSTKNNLIVINGIVMDIRFAEIKGTLMMGALAEAEGYYDSSGVFIVTKIEFKNPSSGGSLSVDDNGNDHDDDNDNDDNEINENDNNSNDNVNDD